jgi:hypothetical protein
MGVTGGEGKNDGSYVPPESFLRKLIGITKFDLENSWSRRDFPIPDDCTMEQYGPYAPLFPVTSRMCCSRASSALVPMNGASQDFVTAKKYGISDFVAKVRSGEITFFL